MLPTLAHLAGAALPEQKIDGKSIWPILSGAENARSPHEAFYYYWGKELHAVRSQQWKLHFPHSYRSLDGEPGSGGMPGPYLQKECGLELYNLDTDIGELTDVAAEHPEIVAKLKQQADAIRQQLGDSLTKKNGQEIRPAGTLP